MNNEKTLYMIDGSAYIYRAYHAIQSLTNSKGLPTNAAFGFTRMLLKLIDDRAPEYIVMFFDAKGPTFRHEMYADYKANRPPMPDDLSIQIPYIKEITKGFNMPVIEMPGYEADDLIGTFSRIAEKAGFNVVMVTGDKDFMQLVTDKAIIWDPMKEKTIDADVIRTTYGIEPQQMIDVMGLSGDTADNIPGVPGIGQKTALSLIKTYKSMTQLYEQIDTIKKKKQHENLVKYKDQAFLSRNLVTINTDVPSPFNIEEFKSKTPDNNILSGLFKDLEFRQLQQAFPRQSDLSGKSYNLVNSIDALSDLISRLEAAEMFAVDTETTSENPMNAKLVGFSFALKPDEAFYIPCCHDYPDVPDQLDLADVLTLIKPVLENRAIKKIGQNIKYDWIVLSRHGINLAGVMFDTMLASYLLNPSKRAHNLDQIALDFLDHRTITYKEVVGTGDKSSGFAGVSLKKAAPYACEDADITLMAYNVLKPMLKETGLTELFEKVEMPLVPVLMKMEMTGICVDREKLSSLSKSFEHQLEALKDSIYSTAGEEFNINSSQQLGRILFEKLNLPTQKKTKKKTGYSTDVDVLTVLADQHELPAIILRYRTLSKLKSTYTDALLELVHPETRRIHTSFNQTVTATGRLSSSNPNLQNIPVRIDEGREIRKAFIPKKGWSMVSADYSQIELRILAHYSDDQILIKAFKNDEDIHTRTAAEVFQVFPSFITSELRQQAKVINFGIVYGMSAYGLSKELGISRKMATTYIENYFARYKGVKKFIDHAIEDARQTKKTSTLLGRIRLLPDINSPNKNVREFAERTAINTPIQGSAADLIKVAMINVNSALRAKNLKTAMLLSVHDEIVFEAPHDEIDLVQELVKNIMEGVWDLKVPLKVNIASGINWAEAH
ncbi:MAG: DNA polymerase I [Desulfobacteraceae bacterium Eth-SRB1]|nr:MAG: DNA polymerase I [Desulfobacteraceae bacterium Eth-SRB1]